ncbi:MAG: UDP-N-acetylmuramyl pentapeptide synthase [Planctomycetota bacterium]|jgi:UDP-N-acetylmuramoyl-tripeptide--D-alanyl-D-alanine ligase
MTTTSTLGAGSAQDSTFGFPVAALVAATGARLVSGDPSVVATRVCTDTRKIQRGDVFFALSGLNHDGNHFAIEACAKGAAAVVLEERASAREVAAALPRGFVALVAADTRRALGGLANMHRRRLSSRVIGVTGSCGKTTVKNMLVELLSSRWRTLGSPSSFNNDVGVPQTIFLADASTEALVVEMGTNHHGEIGRLCEIAEPEAGIVTTVGASHLEGLGSIAGVAREKGALPRSIPASGFVVLNADNPWTSAMASETRARVLTFGLEGSGEFSATDIAFDRQGTTFRMFGQKLRSPLLGLHNVQNLAAAIAACHGFGVGVDELEGAIARLAPARGRLQRIDAGRLTLVDDSYNANPESVRAAIDTLASMRGHRRRVLVLGDMAELGERAGDLHHEVGAAAARDEIDLLVLVGELSRATAAGALEAGMPRSRAVHCADIDEARAIVPPLLAGGDVVLFKASRASGLERLSEAILAAEQAQGNAA